MSLVCGHFLSSIQTTFKLIQKVTFPLEKLLSPPQIKVKYSAVLAEIKHFSIQLCQVLWYAPVAVCLTSCISFCQYVSSFAKSVKAAGHSRTFCFPVCVFTNATSKQEVVDIYPTFPFFSFCSTKSLPYSSVSKTPWCGSSVSARTRRFSPVKNTLLVLLFALWRQQRRQSLKLAKLD